MLRFQIYINLFNCTAEKVHYAMAALKLKSKSILPAAKSASSRCQKLRTMRILCGVIITVVCISHHVHFELLLYNKLN